jgi:hypothetical protein
MGDTPTCAEASCDNAVMARYKVVCGKHANCPVITKDGEKKKYCPKCKNVRPYKWFAGLYDWGECEPCRANKGRKSYQEVWTQTGTQEEDGEVNGNDGYSPELLSYLKEVSFFDRMEELEKLNKDLEYKKQTLNGRMKVIDRGLHKSQGEYATDSSDKDALNETIHALRDRKRRIERLNEELESCKRKVPKLRNHLS